MGLTKKTVYTMILIMIVSVSTIILFLWIFVSAQFKKTEVKEAEKNMKRFVGIINREIEDVDSFCRDYAFWVDSVNFMIAPSEDYIENNFSTEYMKTQNIQLVCHINLKGKVVHSVFYNGNLDSYKQIVFDDFEDNSSDLAHIASGVKNNIFEEKGIIETSSGLLLVATNPIRNSFVKGEIVGKLVIGRMLNDNAVFKLCSLLKVKGDVIPIDKVKGADNHLLGSFDKNSNSVIHNFESDFIKTYSLISDVKNNPAALLMLQYPREIKLIGNQTVQAMAAILFFWGLILFKSVFYFMKKNVITPLENLTERALKIDKFSDFNSRLPIKTDDEISTLAWTFNGLLDRLDEVNFSLEQKVMDRTHALLTSNQELMLMQQVFNHSLEGITITDKDANILKVNPAFSAITGYEPDEVLGKNPRILKSDHHDEHYYMEMWKSLSSEGQWSSEIWNRHKDGKAYPEWISISAIRDSDGEITHYVGLFHDISDMKRQEEFIRYQAFHDSLTGLPNRILLTNRLDRAIAHASRDSLKFGVIFLDLDNFKNVNDSLGHVVGDVLLRDAAERLRNLTRSVDTVARLGGDEFVIIVEDISDEKPAVYLAQRIIDSFKKPFTLKENSIHVGASIGIALFPEDGVDSDVLIRNADTAMYRTKESGREGFTMFTSSLNENVSRRLKLENDLRKAIKNNEFEVHYQPKMEIKTCLISGMEGLVRWRHSEGLISPDDFIPLAEETGLICEMDKVVMSIAFQEIGGLISSGVNLFKLALNCSTKALYLKELPELISEALSKHNIKPEWFELEITETSIMKNFKESIATLNSLLEIGISISLDDFGTGYSSLAHLKNLPISSLKIDKSFVWEMEKNRSDAHITESIIAMSKKIGVEVIAEGVEKIEQLNILDKAGCDIAQGYYISKPLPLHELKSFLHSFNQKKDGYNEITSIIN